MLNTVCRLLLGVATIVLLSACAANNYQSFKAADYPVFRKNFDVTIGWNVVANDRQATVAGYVRNNRYHIMQDLELWIALLDAGGVERAQKSFFVLPSRLYQDESARFSVEFGNSLKPGDKLRFLYHYKGVEDNEQALSWMNSFEVPAE